MEPSPFNLLILKMKMIHHSLNLPINTIRNFHPSKNIITGLFKQRCSICIITNTITKVIFYLKGIPQRGTVI